MPPTSTCRASLTKILDRLILAIVLLLVLTPLVYWRPLVFFFEESKGFFVVAVTELLVLLLAWRAGMEALPRLRLGRVDLAQIIFFSALFLAGLLGADPWTSFWGDANRVTGLFYVLHLLVLFFLLRIVLRTTKHWECFLTASLCVALIVGAIHLLDLIGVFTVLDSSNGATIGNSTYLSVYLLFHVFFGLYLWLTAFHRLRRWIGLFSAAVLSALLVAPLEAYAVIGSLIGGLVFFTILAMILGDGGLWMRRIGWGTMIALVAAFFGLWALMLQSDSSLRASVAVSTAPGRFIMWDIAMQGIRERPFLGWGPENFPIVFSKYYNPCLGTPSCGFERVFDRAHNKLLDLWVEAGFFGVAAYVAVLLAAATTLWKAARTSSNSALGASTLLALLASYTVQNLTSLDVAITLLFFTITLALIQSLDPSPPEKIHRSLPGGPAVALSASALVVVAAWLFVLQPLRASHAAAMHHTGMTKEEEILRYEIADTSSGYGSRFFKSILAFDVLAWLNSEAPSVLETETTFVKDVLTRAQWSMRRQITRTPYDPRLYALLGTLYQMEGRYLGGDGYEQAIRTLQEGVSRHPRHYQPAWGLVSVYLETGQFELAQTLSREIRDRSPEDLLGRYNFLVTTKFTLEAEAFNQFVASELKDYPVLQDLAQQLSEKNLTEDRAILLNLPGKF